MTLAYAFDHKVEDKYLEYFDPKMRSWLFLYIVLSTAQSSAHSKEEVQSVLYICFCASTA